MADQQLQVVTTVANEFEANMVLGLLKDAGIESFQRLGGSGVAGRFGGGGAREVLVAEDDLDEARAVLESAQED